MWFIEVLTHLKCWSKTILDLKEVLCQKKFFLSKNYLEKIEVQEQAETEKNWVLIVGKMVI